MSIQRKLYCLALIQNGFRKKDAGVVSGAQTFAAAYARDHNRLRKRGQWRGVDGINLIHWCDTKAWCDAVEATAFRSSAPAKLQQIAADCRRIAKLLREGVKMSDPQPPGELEKLDDEMRRANIDAQVVVEHDLTKNDNVVVTFDPVTQAADVAIKVKI